MSFTIQMSEILQYAYNLFASALPLLYLFLGASFGAFCLTKLLGLLK